MLARVLVSRPEDSKRETYKNTKRFLIRSLKGKAMRNFHWEIYLGQFNIIKSLMNTTVVSLLLLTIT